MPARTCSPWPTAWAATPAATSPARRSSAPSSASTASRSAVDATPGPARAGSRAPTPSSATSVAHDDPDLDGMGTTLIAMLRAGDKLVLAHIGDSRAFMVRDGVVTQITKDHSLRAEPRRRGPDHRRGGQTHPQRSLVTRVLTGADDDEPDLVVRQARVGDRYLICSRRAHRLRRARHHRRGAHRPSASPADDRRPARRSSRCARAPPTTSPSSSATSSTSRRSCPATRPQIVGAAAAIRRQHPADPRHPGRQGGSAHRRGQRPAPTPTTASPLPRRAHPVAPPSACASSASAWWPRPARRGRVCRVAWSQRAVLPRRATTASSPSSRASTRRSARSRSPSAEYATASPSTTCPTSIAASCDRGIKVETAPSGRAS